MDYYFIILQSPPPPPKKKKYRSNRYYLQILPIDLHLHELFSLNILMDGSVICYQYSNIQIFEDNCK